MYSAALGRFLQTDPIGYSDGLNWYAYVDNNPTNRIDPLGLLRFGCRPLDDMGTFNKIAGFFYGGLELITDPLNVGFYHEAGFYQDSSGDYADFGPPRTENYEEYYEFGDYVYDDDVMRQAQENVDASGEFDAEDYGLLHNCQDYCSALREEYEKLGGETEYNPRNKTEGMKKK